MEKVVEMLQREDGCIGLARVMAIIIFILWISITIGTFVTQVEYAHYNMLSETMALSMAAVGFGKWVDFRGKSAVK